MRDKDGLPIFISTLVGNPRLLLEQVARGTPASIQCQVARGTPASIQCFPRRMIIFIFQCSAMVQDTHFALVSAVVNLLFLSGFNGAFLQRISRYAKSCMDTSAETKLENQLTVASGSWDGINDLQTSL